MIELMLIGEAWGEKEEETGQPFVGSSGYILNQLLSQVGIDRSSCYLTNVFNLRPKPSNDIKNLCGSKAEGIPGLPVLQKGKYVLRKYQSELDRLYSEIRREQPNLIIALGATAAWALLDTTGIKNIRGAITTTSPRTSAILGRQFKVLPTYHPAAIARSWGDRPVAMADLDKAKRHSKSADIVRPKRELWIKPTLKDLEKFDEYIQTAEILSVDIETASGQITCIGFAPSDSLCIIIPFHSASAPDGNYWQSLEEELRAWSYVRRWLLARSCLFQNGMYDITFLWRVYRMPVNAAEDTMLMHHAWQPEMEKGLGFLASIYTDEWSWKQMRKGLKHD